MYYECFDEIVVQNITFLFNGWEFTLTSEDLFEKNDATKIFLLYYNRGSEEFSLAGPLLKKFEIVYDQANNQIGFYHESVKYKGNQKVTPPKIFEFLEDEEEYQPKIVENQHEIIPDGVPEEVRINNTADVPENRNYQTTNVIKYILYILILIVVIIIIFSLCIYSKKYDKNKKVKKTKKYLEEEMDEKNNDN